MKMYILTCGEYSDEHIISIYSTLGMAKLGAHNYHKMHMLHYELPNYGDTLEEAIEEYNHNRPEICKFYPRNFKLHWKGNYCQMGPYTIYEKEVDQLKFQQSDISQYSFSSFENDA